MEVEYQSLHPQKTPHTSPYRASYGVSFLIILEKFEIITAMHCSIEKSIYDSMTNHAITEYYYMVPVSVDITLRLTAVLSNF